MAENAKVHPKLSDGQIIQSRIDTLWQKPQARRSGPLS